MHAFQRKTRKKKILIRKLENRQIEAKFCSKLFILFKRTELAIRDESSIRLNFIEIQMSRNDNLKENIIV